MDTATNQAVLIIPAELLKGSEASGDSGVNILDNVVISPTKQATAEVLASQETELDKKNTLAHLVDKELPAQIARFEKNFNKYNPPATNKKHILAICKTISQICNLDSNYFNTEEGKGIYAKFLDTLKTKGVLNQKTEINTKVMGRDVSFNKALLDFITFSNQDNFKNPNNIYISQKEENKKKIRYLQKENNHVKQQLSNFLQKEYNIPKQKYIFMEDIYNLYKSFINNNLPIDNRIKNKIQSIGLKTKSGFLEDSFLKYIYNTTTIKISELDSKYTSLVLRTLHNEYRDNELEIYELSEKQYIYMRKNFTNYRLYHKSIFGDISDADISSCMIFSAIPTLSSIGYIHNQTTRQGLWQYITEKQLLPVIRTTTTKAKTEIVPIQANGVGEKILQIIGVVDTHKIIETSGEEKIFNKSLYLKTATGYIYIFDINQFKFVPYVEDTISGDSQAVNPNLIQLSLTNFN